MSVARAGMFGRRVIRTNADAITEDNLLDELKQAMNVHSLNSADIDYLWKYYKGDQPILSRVKNIRPEINNKVVENRAAEIITFKVGYQCGKPIKYVAMSAEKDTTGQIVILNDMMHLCGKEANDQKLFEWIFVGGVGYRMVLPLKDEDRTVDDAPFALYVTDPRNTFVVYSTDIDEKPMMGVKFSVNSQTSTVTYSVYTRDTKYEVENDRIVKKEPHYYGRIPIFEYTAPARVGAFEWVVPLLDAVNDRQSNRMDGVAQNIQSFLKFINCAVDKAQMESLKELGAIMIKALDGQKADVDTVKTDLDQTQTQTLKQDLLTAIYSISCMPSTSDGSTSDSSNNGAVVLKNGWENAETTAAQVENLYKQSEMQMLKFVLHLLRSLENVDIRLADIDIKFTRRNYENIQSKSQVFISMLGSDKCHPLLAFESCGMFSDPEGAYTMSKAWWEENERKQQAELDKLTGVGGEDE